MLKESLLATIQYLNIISSPCKKNPRIKTSFSIKDNFVNHQYRKSSFFVHLPPPPAHLCHESQSLNLWFGNRRILTGGKNRASEAESAEL